MRDGCRRDEADVATSYASVNGLPPRSSAHRRVRAGRDGARSRQGRRTGTGSGPASRCRSTRRRSARAEREDRVLAVAGVVVRRAVCGEDRQVRLAAEAVVERAEQVADRLRPRARRPRASARRPPCRHARGSGPGSRYVARRRRWSRRSPLWLNANRPAGSSNGCVSARVSVESRDGRRRWTRATVVSVAPTASRPGSSRKARTSRYEQSRPSAATPRRAPAETREAEPLELLGERPQFVETERLGGPGDEVLAHLRRMLPSGPSGYLAGRAMRAWISSSYSGK